MSNPLDKVIDLIKKTGDNCIIIDKSGNPTYVIMDFGKYQAMHQGNHQVEPVDKSADEHEYADLEDLGQAIPEVQNTPEVVDNSLNKAENKSDSEQTEEKYYFEPID